MRHAPAAATTLVASVVFVACTDVAGLSSYSACADCMQAADASEDAPAIAPVEASPVDEPGDDEATSPPTDSAPPANLDSGGTWRCAKGGCNSAGGACSALSACYCARDPDCASGACVASAGHNDLSCGAGCTGSGPADGFGCALASPGIPATCTATGFGYTPSNFAATAYSAHVPPTQTTIDCDLTYDVATHAFTACTGACTGSFCTGATPPFIAADVAQTSSGGPNVDILVSRDLSLRAGRTLTIASTGAGGGGNAVVLAVFGDALIEGTLRVDGAPGASGGALGTNTPGASGAGGGHGCTTATDPGSGLNGGPSCNSATNDCRDSGGGGAGASGAGGDGAAGVSGNQGNGGGARANAALVPLYGGCPGGTSGGFSCTTYGGGGGGAVQISAAGTLTVTGSISASGGAGGSSTCSSVQSTCGTTYPGGAGGGGSGGGVLLEAQSVVMTGAIAVNGGGGGNAQGAGAGGAGGTSTAPAGKSGAGSAVACGNASSAGGGGGGGYGYLRANGGQPAASYSCVTTLSPAPVCNAAHSACACSADSECSSGRCLPSEECAGPCTGAGPADAVGCQLLESAPSP
jgi:hypothetical protein